MVGESTSLPDQFFDTSAEQFGETKFLSTGVESPDDIFSILEALEGVSDEFTAFTPLHETDCGTKEGGFHQLASQKSTSSSAVQELEEMELEAFSPRSKKRKVSSAEEGCENSDGQLKMSHVTVERNRRKQMNEHLTVLRSLMPCFYVKRGDQASIIGGVINYITELQQVLQSLEAKKQRKVYSDVLSPRLISSPRTLPLSPRKPPLSPRPSLPISPRTPQSASPYRHRLPSATSYLLSPSSMANITPASPCNSSSNSDTINELVANSKSSVADVEVKFSGPNLLLKTLSPKLPGQATKIVSVLEDLSLEILQATINTDNETMVNSFTIKIGIECKLSAEDLAEHIQLTFC
ncbi:transcription factor SPEECHLESS [Lactuca sativa]|uniref:transcription factor SPEECHLESS n=1 Tax=Lactuca sativa TaxID=4236 RepID=UPI000CD7EE24|nr:transcription factor SPEECHLESS [Lactuca sativa]